MAGSSSTTRMRGFAVSMCSARLAARGRTPCKSFVKAGSSPQKARDIAPLLPCNARVNRGRVFLHSRDRASCPRVPRVTSTSFHRACEEADLMALINRMSRLLTADVHAVLDRIEEPDVLLKHAVREMEEELARGEQRARALAHEHEGLGERQRKAEAALQELGLQLDVCFENDNEELARRIIKRRLETERLVRHVAERRATLAKELAALSAPIGEQREQLD